MVVLLTDNEKKEVEWYARHHKANVAYLAEKIKELVDNPDDEGIRKFFYSHFKATIDDFIATTHPRWCPHTKEWEDEESAKKVH